MKKEIKVEEKIVTIYHNESNEHKEVPVVILNTFDEDGQEIWDKSEELTDKDYILVTISNINWNQDMSPWYMDRLFKSENDYTGKADEFINLLKNRIVPEVSNVIKGEIKYEISQFILAGYSLAGLFAVYSMYKIDVFNRMISVSGSLWYPKFVEFVEKNKWINKPEKIYFSLGNKESKTKNEMMSKVEENTKYLVDYYKKQGVETIYAENDGNHFQDIILRIVKGICWILE